MSRKNIRCFILVLFLFAGGIGFAQSAIPTFSGEQIAAHGKVTVLILVAASTGEENKAVKDILSQSIRIEVENAGFKAESRSLNADRVKDLLGDRDKLNSSLLKFSQKANADFTIFCTYKLIKDTLKLEFSLFDTGKSSITNSRKMDVKLNLFSDIVISSAVSGLIKESEQRVQYVAANKPVNIETPGSTGNAEVSKKSQGDTASQNTAGNFSAGSKSAQNESAALKPEDRGRVIKGGGIVITLPKKYRHLDFGLGFAPFIPIGGLSTYLKIAYNPYAVFSYRVFIPFGIVGIGFRIGSSIGYASGIAARGILTLSPVGIDISYATFRMAFLSLFLRTTGGMAIIALFPEGETLSGAAFPYVEGGAGLSIFFTDSLKLSAEVAYSVYFNPDPLIMGLVPTLMLSILL